MVKKTILYTDFNGNDRKEDFYFNLTDAEVAEIEMSTTGGLSEMITRIVNAQDTPAIIKVFKDLILKAYGEKSDDGKKFIKVKNGIPLSEDFAQTEAFSVLFMELATDANKASEFFNSLIVKKKESEKKESGNKTS